MALDLTLACGEYDLTDALNSGEVEPDGINLTTLNYPAPERHGRAINTQEFDIAEISFGSYLTSMAHAEEFPFTAIPVFPHRRFRQSYMFKNSELDIKSPQQLGGKKVGLEMWQTTSGIWMRGIAREHYGLDLEEVTWVLHQTEDISFDIPEKFDVEFIEQAEDMEQMVIDGDIDATFYPVVLDSVKDPDGGIDRIFENSLEAEENYYKETGIFPIMHTVVIRDDILEKYPWVGVNMMNAFSKSRDVCYEKLEDPRWTALAWARQHLEHQQKVIGKNPWKYGATDENMNVINKLQEYAKNQGLIPEIYGAEDLFFEKTVNYRPKKHASGSHG